MSRQYEWALRHRGQKVHVAEGNASSSTQAQVDGIEDGGLATIAGPIKQLMPGAGDQSSALMDRKFRMAKWRIRGMGRPVRGLVNGPCRTQTDTNSYYAPEAILALKRSASHWLIGGTWRHAELLRELP